MSKQAKRITLGAIIAGTLGYLAGILTAPKSGRETRKDIKDTTNQTISQVEKELKKLHGDLNDLIQKAMNKSDKLKGKAKDDLLKLTQKAKDAKEKLREMLSAVHEGESQDPELKNAIDEASKAIKHIKEYLSKK